MRCALIDIDGTLTDTAEVDNECYMHSLDAVFGFPGRESAYARDSCEHVTDPGLLASDLGRYLGGRAAAKEIIGNDDVVLDEGSPAPQLADPRVYRVTARRLVSLWDNVFVFALLLGSLTLEWWLRRRSGLL